MSLPSRRSTDAASLRPARASRLLVAALAGSLGVCALAIAGHRPPSDPPPPPTVPGAPGGGHDGGDGNQLPPTTPGGGGLSGMFARLEALAIVDQFPPAAVAEFESLYLGWIEFISSSDRVMPFDEWLWANGVEDPEAFEMFMTLYMLLVKVGG